VNPVESNAQQIDAAPPVAGKEGQPAAHAPPDAAVDAQHPWLGLASFTEETRQYFHAAKRRSPS